MDSYVGPYQILRLVNQGGQGSVYLGYDKRLHRRVAIKICDLPRVRAERKTLLDEAQLVAKIQSPKVVQVFDVIESGTHLGLVMEYVPGCSLEDFLSRVRPSLASVVRVGLDVAGALAMVRQQRIVHGDVKAGNILIAENGRAKLTDFGISRSGEGHSGRQWGGGSPSAISPEQVRGESLDDKADLFALGCLLYRMMSGEHPFYRNGRFDTEMLLNEPPRPLVEVTPGDLELPDKMVSLINALLDKDPRRRPPHTRRVRQALRYVGRSLPMASRNSLQIESRPYFRNEPEDNLPPPIPEALGQRGRSALVPTGNRWVRTLHWLKTLRGPARTGLAAALVAIGSLPVLLAHFNGVTPVRFAKPVTSVAGETGPPVLVSAHWLVDEVKDALGEELGAIQIVGPVGAVPEPDLYAGGRPLGIWARPEQSFQLVLSCIEGLCIFTISRDAAGDRIHRQSVLLPHMTYEEWREVVRDTTYALYR